MVLTDYFYTHAGEEGEDDLRFPTILYKNDPDHKTFNYDGVKKRNYVNKYPKNKEAINLIKKAKKSFTSYKKIKDKYMKKKYIKAGISSEQIKRSFYLSDDKKFYCIYFSMTEGDGVLYYIIGIIEKTTNKHLMIIREFWSGIYDALYIKHNKFDYYTGDQYLEKTCKFNPNVLLSSDSSESLDNDLEPLKIIDSLEDYFTVLFEELSNK